jgi:hypothetical protein
MRRLTVAVLLTGVLSQSAWAQFGSPPQLPAPLTGQAPVSSLYPAKMSIVDPKGVEARSGPTPDYYPTSRLKYGDVVAVLRESEQQPGWFAIAPPAGSFSWIDAKHVLQVSARQGVVALEGNGVAAVMPGSSLVNKEPNVESVKIASGSIVILLQDRPMDVNGKKWWPIQPPGNEARFIPKEAVQPAQAVKVTPQNWSLSNPPAGASNQNSWTAPGQLIGSPANPPAGTPASFSQPAKDWTASNGLTTQPPQWSQWGKLRRTAFTKDDGQPMYVLEDRQGRPILYVTTTAGTSLRGYVEQQVCLYGAISYRSDGYQRTYYMTASHVATP